MKFRKICAVLLGAVMVMSMAACGGNSSETSTDADAAGSALWRELARILLQPG